MRFDPTVLWRWDGRIGRATYLALGAGLFVLKFCLDFLISKYFFGREWAVSDYIKPEGRVDFATEGAQLITLWLVSLPFLWAGVVLTIKRLRSAALPLWLVVLFVVPMVKFVLFAILCVLPKREQHVLPPLQTSSPQGSIGDRDDSGKYARLGIFSALMLAVFGVILGAQGLRDYGWALFICLPFCMGFVSTLVYCTQKLQSLKNCILVAYGALGCAGVLLLLLNLEGFLCLVMASPVALVLAAVGAMIAYAIRKSREDMSKLFCPVFLAVPLTMGIEHYQAAEAPLLEVKTAVVVNAPPEKVWRNVVTFSELPPPREWLFRAGIAYPIHAKIQGQGRGAIRYCNFSTGPFVEPIEVWDEPALLKFSVTDNPAPMREMSLYGNLHPPHLDGFLVSKAGQFQLVRLPDGRTRLEGTTWYHHNLWPAGYWQIWSDYIIHRIHLRVLNHVKALSEKEQ